MDEEQMRAHPWGAKMILKLLLLLGIIAIVIVAMLRDRFVNNPQWQVTVVGQGKVSYVPDIATITLGVQIDKASTAQLAVKLLNERMKKILAAIQAAGVPAEDVQTQNYSLNPQYDYRDNISVLSGYNANQQLTVKIRNFSQDSQTVSKVIDEANKAGANQVLGVNFDVSNVNDLRQQARIKALADARSKAQGLADAANVHLGKVVGWYENYLQGPGMPTAYYDGKGGIGGGPVAAPSQVPVGTQEIVLEMSLNYRVK